MSPRPSLRAFLTDETGAAAVEFALVAMLFLGLMVGTIDVSRLMWELNSAKAGTRAAVRLAATTSPAANELVNYDAISKLGVAAGTAITAADVATYTCTSVGCVCSGAGACGSTALNTTSFNAIVAAIHAYYGRVTSANVVVQYTPVGIGFAGNPYGPDVEPLVTVRLCDPVSAGGTDATGRCSALQFAPGVLQAFGVSPFNMPPVASSMSGEDLS